jgi:hypothetical protein
MKIVISSGHSTKCPGASGIIDEVTEATKVVDKVYDLLKSAGVTVLKFHDTTSTTSSQNLNRIVEYHNFQDRDLDVSVHFNAYQNTQGPMGTECLYVTQKDLSAKVSSGIASVSGLIDRGPKYRSDLYFLNHTEMPAILIEVCFVDSQTDVNLYHLHFDKICESIAESISGVDVDEDLPPVDGEEEEIPTVEIRSTKNVKIIVNGIEVGSDTPPQFVHQNITATVFGAGSDAQDTAYGGHVDDRSHGVALPFRFEGDRPKVWVYGPHGEELCGIIDVGPWNTNDPMYVQDQARPLSESQYADHTLAQNGKIPSNDAGIDLAPRTAEILGISGKGKVSWKYA